VWQVAHVAKFPVPPEPEGATACVEGGGPAWQIVHVVEPSVNCSTLSRWPVAGIVVAV
jgi:hypothetical protein